VEEGSGEWEGRRKEDRPGFSVKWWALVSLGGRRERRMRRKKKGEGQT
jgi:hypothetical protein